MSDDVNEPADTDDQTVEPEQEELAGESEAAAEGAAPQAAVETATGYDTNALVFGRLVLHYESRDVTLILDGASALRLLAMFAQRRSSGLDDRIDPATSSALSGWVVLDVLEPLAMSWEPGLPQPRPRTAIDPAAPAAA